MRYCVFDLETGTKKVHKRKANPWYNNIVAVGIKYQDVAPLTEYTKTGIISLDFLNDADILIGHNIKFDLLYLWKYPKFQNWLLSGGRIWDTQLAEYVLTGQQAKYSSLRDIAVKKYGCTEREKKMEKYWDKGIDTIDIPPELVTEDVRNDVLDTEQIMLKQIMKAQNENMYTLIMELMEGLLATCEMEYNGIFINKEIMRNNTETLKKEVSGLHEECLAIIKGVV